MMKRYTGNPVGFQAVSLGAGFWKDVQDTGGAVTMGAVYEQFQKTGRFDALKCGWKEGMPFKPHIFWDSDAAKWIEGASYYLAQERDRALEEKIDQLADWMAAHQWEDGYINSYFTAVEPEARFTRRADHELYCAGHLLEGAIAYYAATGKRKLLDAAVKYADLIDDVFRVRRAAAFDTPGHQEIELALVKLFRLTGNEKYKRLAEFFIDQRGRSDKDTPRPNKNREYCQSHLPVREQKTAVGHAVRLLYQLCAMADLALLNREAALTAACEALFENITTRKMHITGGVGSTHVGERFTFDYDLPEYNTYNETCASIALAMFCRRMWLIDADSKYADCAEQALYNTVLSGVSLSGDSFFYENPLAANPEKTRYYAAAEESMRERMPIIERVKVFSCSCCPPNLLRLMGSIGDYMYSTAGDTIFAHCYMNGDAVIPLGDRPITLRQQTDYPFDGRIALTTETAGEYGIAVRIPGWCGRWMLYLNGEAAEASLDKGYACLFRRWQPGDQLLLALEMEAQLMEANPKAGNLCGKCAVTRGPMVFCAEGIDNQELPIRDILLQRDAVFSCENERICGRRLPVLRTQVKRRRQFDSLYRPMREDMEEDELKLIPYMAWANRGVTEMAVWLNVR
ncbi:MAG: glycoside hydrolase family 127 protein [Clostridia bacterium]|nr:glycoside hydrolase family 127 protein [Clostridia bacterium]